MYSGTFSASSTNFESWWNPGQVNACHGAAACYAAYIWYSKHSAEKGAAETTKIIAATYCMTNVAACFEEQVNYESVSSFVSGVALLAGGAIGARTTQAATNTIDDLLSSGRQVSGRFPRTANADEVLFRRGADGSVTHYQVYGQDGLPLQRVDVTGASHAGVPTPHVLEFERHLNPATGQVFVRPADTVRPALPEEIPGAG